MAAVPRHPDGRRRARPRSDPPTIAAGGSRPAAPSRASGRPPSSGRAARRRPRGAGTAPARPAKRRSRPRASRTGRRARASPRRLRASPARVAASAPRSLAQRRQALVRGHRRSRRRMAVAWSRSPVVHSTGQRPVRAKRAASASPASASRRPALGDPVRRAALVAALAPSRGEDDAAHRGRAVGRQLACRVRAERRRAAGLRPAVGPARAAVIAVVLAPQRPAARERSKPRQPEQFPAISSTGSRPPSLRPAAA